MARQEREMGARQLAGFAIGIGLFVAIMLLPAPGGMKPEAQRVAAMTALMAAWWIGEALPIGMTALIPLAALPLMGVSSAKAAAAPYANHNIFLFMGGFFIAMAMQKWNLHRRIALAIVDFIGLKPRRIVLGFMVATAFLSMWISNTATTLMMVPIAMAVLSSVDGGAGRGAKSNLGYALTLGIAYAASVGGMGTLVGTPPNIIFAAVAGELVPGYEVSFVNWMMAAMPFVVVFLPLVWLFLTRVLYPLQAEGDGDGGGEVIKTERRKLGPMSFGEKGTLIIFCATAFLWMTREGVNAGGLNIPGWKCLFPHPGYIKDSTVAMAMGLLLFIIPVDIRRGKFLLDLEWMLKLPWDIILLLGGGFSLAAAVSASGLGEWAGSCLHGIGNLPVILTTGIVALTLIFLTEIMSNTATTTLMLPILGGVALKSGVNPLVFLIPATLGASCAFMLPSGTPPNAIVFATGRITLPQMAKAGFYLNLAAAIALTFLVPYLVLPLLGVHINL